MKHLDEGLPLDTAAAHLLILKYRFGRVFKEGTGKSVYAFIKCCKIDRSAIDMKLNPIKAIIGTGLDYGYSVSSYSSVFRQHHDTSPSMFRQPIPTRSMSLLFSSERIVHFKTAEEYIVQIEIQKQGDLFVLYERFIGTYTDLEESWYQFLGKYKDFLSERALLIE